MILKISKRFIIIIIIIMSPTTHNDVDIYY